MEPKLLIQNVVDNLSSKHDMFPLQRAAAACSESFYCCVGFFNCREQMDRGDDGQGKPNRTDILNRKFKTITRMFGAPEDIWKQCGLNALKAEYGHFDEIERRDWGFSLRPGHVFQGWETELKLGDGRDPPEFRLPAAKNIYRRWAEFPLTVPPDAAAAGDAQAAGFGATSKAPPAKATTFKAPPPPPKPAPSRPQPSTSIFGAPPPLQSKPMPRAPRPAPPAAGRSPQPLPH